MESVRDRLRCVIEEIEDWKFLSFGEERAKEGKEDEGEGEEGDAGEERDVKMEEDGEGEDVSS